MPRPTFSYNHLLYFLVVVREGSMTRAAEVLGVTQPTVSAQVAELERSLGTRLFRRRGSRLVLTEEGRVTQRYAAEIFALGSALEQALEGARGAAPLRFVVGISDSLPLLTAHHLLGPALALPPQAIRLVLRADKTQQLLADLSARTLDLALTDEPVGPTSVVRAHSHLLVESPVAIFGTPPLIETLEGPFPACMDGAPFLLHTEHTPLRRALDRWFVRERVKPFVAAEVENVAFLQVLAEAGRGFFAAPTLVEDTIRDRYHVERVGRAEGAVERIYAVTLDAEPAHPAVRAVLSGVGAPTGP